MKKNLTGLELKHIVFELQQLAGSKVAKIYQPEKNEIYIQLYSSRTGKKLVRIAVPRFVYICEERQESPDNPYGFLQSLRKHLDQSILKSVEQPGLERLARFKFQAKDEEYSLVVELFGKGNAV
ncbi:MAG: NFACT family protein, partial [Candidatus Woesearchaeota archaeon]